MNWFKKLKKIYRDLITAAAWVLVILFGYCANLTQIDVLYTLTFVFLIPAIVFTVFAVKANKIKAVMTVTKEPVPPLVMPIPDSAPPPAQRKPVPSPASMPISDSAPPPAPAQITELSETVSPYDFVNIKVVGVSFKNDDGTNRQTILRKMRWRDGEFANPYEISLEKYDYNGAPAWAVLANQKGIGNLPKEMVDYVSSVASRVENVAIDIHGGGYDKETGEKLNYGATITLKIKKE